MTRLGFNDETAGSPSRPAGCRVRKVTRGILLAASVLIVVGLIGELCVRLLAPQVLPRDNPGLWRPDSDIGWRRSPNITAIVNSGERNVAFCTDSLGSRVPCSDAARDCTRRILVVGDSFVEALSIDYAETVWGRIEEETGLCVDVAGVAGYGIAQYRATVIERLQLDDRPLAGIIIALYVGNDLDDDLQAIPPPTRVQHIPFRLWPRSATRAGLREWFYPVSQWLERWSHAYVGMRRAVRRMRDPADIGLYGVPVALRPSWLTHERADAITASLMEIVTLADESGIRVLVAVIPSRLQVLDPRGTRVLEEHPQLAGDLDMDHVSSALIPRLAGEGRTGVVDLLPGLRQRADISYWGRNDRHFSPKGHAAWFEIMIPAVWRLLAAGSTDASAR